MNLYLKVYVGSQEKRFHIDDAVDHGFDEVFLSFFFLFQVTREIFGHLRERFICIHLYFSLIFLVFLMIAY